MQPIFSKTISYFLLLLYNKSISILYGNNKRRKNTEERGEWC